MHKIEQLKDALTKELDNYSDKGKLDVGSLDVIDKLAHAIKNLDKILESESGYSGRRRDSMGRFSGDDYSMDYSGRRYSRDGDMSRGQGGYSSEYSRGGYSSEYSRDMQNIKRELSDIMNEADGRTRQNLQRIISQM